MFIRRPKMLKTSLTAPTQELLRDIGTTPNVIQATNKPGLLDKLDDLMKSLNMCEKALNNYLETKRLAYPRFYFVSSADLLG